MPDDNEEPRSGQVAFRASGDLHNALAQRLWIGDSLGAAAKEALQRHFLFLNDQLLSVSMELSNEEARFLFDAAMAWRRQAPIRYADDKYRFVWAEVDAYARSTGAVEKYGVGRGGFDAQGFVEKLRAFNDGQLLALADAVERAGNWLRRGALESYAVHAAGLTWEQCTGDQMRESEKRMVFFRSRGVPGVELQP